jgi:hypothetical protein
MDERDEAPTAARPRADIDAGETGDKAGFPDPAAAPLGTDAEASGDAATREELKIARRQEVGRDAKEGERDTEARPVSADHDRG